MSGKKSKVIQFPSATQKKIVCQYSTDTTTEQSPSPKANKLLNYYKQNWPAILGSLLGTTMMFLTVYFAYLTIHGDK